MKSRRGFSLIELLVVIGIIAVLMAILLPSLHRARESARSITCQANVRSIMQGILMYALDNEGVMPVAADIGTVWTPKSPGQLAYFYPPNAPAPGTNIEFQHGAFMRYLGTEATRRRVLRCIEADVNSANYNYVLPANLGTGVSAPIIRLPRVTQAAAKIILVEMNGISARFDGHFNLNESGPDGDQPADLHLRSGKIGYGNHGFADGHVETLTRLDVDSHPLRFDLFR